MATPDGTSVIEHEVQVAASPETVFSYFTDPVKLVLWMGDGATVDPRPGGVCRIDWQRGSAVGKFVEVEPYSRVVFTWGWDPEVFATPAESTLVEVSLTPEAGGTHVRLTHRQLAPEASAFHSVGWSHYLARLAIAAADGDPGPDDLPDTVARRFSFDG